MLFGSFLPDLILSVTPVIIIALFVFSLIRYILGKRLRKKAPDLITHRQLRNRLIMLVVASVVLLLQIVSIILISITL